MDDFGIYRNVYRPLKAFYWTLLSLPYEERRKIANIFTLSLGLYGAEIDDIVRALATNGCNDLARGLEISMGEDKNTVVCAFPLIVTGNMLV